MKYWGKILIVIGIIGMLILFPGGMLTAAAEENPATPDSDITLQKEAKTAIYEKKWERATQLLQQIDNKYPDSAFRAEALYWLAYCLEKQDRKTEALELLNRLITTYPDSPWQDDAESFRLRIAADLVLQGHNQYRPYITEAVQHNKPEDIDLKLAALDALLRIDRQQALPILEKLYAENRNPETRENIIFILRRFGEDKIITRLSRPGKLKGVVTLKEIKDAYIYPSNPIPAPILTHQVDPVYPREALEERIEGDVILILVIDKKGFVQYAVPTKGAHPLLAEAAEIAVKQWKFFPYTMKGKRLDVACVVTLEFALKK